MTAARSGKFDQLITVHDEALLADYQPPSEPHKQARGMDAQALHMLVGTACTLHSTPIQPQGSCNREVMAGPVPTAVPEVWTKTIPADCLAKIEPISGQ